MQKEIGGSSAWQNLRPGFDQKGRKKMDQLDKIEKIREKTGVTYQEAKEALEAADGDILDALVYLENQGKIKKPQLQYYTTESGGSSREFEEAAKAYEGAEDESLGNIVKKFLIWCGKVIKKGGENFFIITKDEEKIMTVPVIVLALLLIFAFWVIIPLLIVGMFCGFRYSFSGNITKSADVNKACDKAAQACESIKQEFKE